MFRVQGRMRTVLQYTFATLITIAVFGSAALIAGKDRTVSLFGLYTYDSEMRAVAQCANSRDVVPCVRPHVQRLLAHNPATTTVAEIVSLNLPRNNCHYVIHVIGQEIYRTYQNVERGYAQCSRLCNAACSHGLIAEAFRSELGFDENAVEHLSVEDIVREGKALCTSGNTCHGIGHALMTELGVAEKAAEVCSAIAKGSLLQDCFRGVYMEYSDQLASRSAWLEADAVSYPDIAQAADVCAHAKAEATEACYYYFPLIVREIYRNGGINDSREDSLTRVKNICAVMKDPIHRRSCMFGWGATQFDQLADTRAALATCTSLPLLSDRRFCAAGMFSLAMEYDQPQRAMSYCAALPASGDRSVCYRTVFEKAQVIERNILDIMDICPAADASCKAAGRAADRKELNEYYW